MFILFLSIIILASSSFKSHKYVLKLELPSRSETRKGSINLGRILHENKKKQPYHLDLEDLTQHMFVCGITGSGKSNLVQHFLLEFTRHHSIPFLLTEFKGEYHFLQALIPDLIILKPGENYSINIFDPEGADPRIHSERIFQIFESGGMFEGIEYSPQMERVFVDILNKICIKEENRNWDRFREICQYNAKKAKDPTIQKSIMAIENRIRRYSLGSLKKIFGTSSELKMEFLFTQNVLLDLSSIIRLGGEKLDALFFLNMILKYLWDLNVARGSKDYEGIRHLTIIEDAQYFAPEKGAEKTRVTTYLEDIALLLRGTGECLISLATRPNISKEILANCGILACFQTHMQKEVMMELLNLEEWQKNYLSMLKKGICILRVNSIEKPFLLIVPHVKRSWLNKEKIKESNQKTLEKIAPLSLRKLEPPYIRNLNNFNVYKNSIKNIKLRKKIDNSNLENEYLNYCILCGKKLDNRNDYCTKCSSQLNRDEEEIKKLENLFEDIINKRHN